MPIRGQVVEERDFPRLGWLRLVYQRAIPEAAMMRAHVACETDSAHPAREQFCARDTIVGGDGGLIGVPQPGEQLREHAEIPDFDGDPDGER